MPCAALRFALNAEDCLEEPIASSSLRGRSMDGAASPEPAQTTPGLGRAPDLSRKSLPSQPDLGRPRRSVTDQGLAQGGTGATGTADAASPAAAAADKPERRREGTRFNLYVA